MTTKRAGHRYPLLIYQRAMDRLWKITFPLGLLMAAWWKWSGQGIFAPLYPPADVILFVSALVVISFSIYALICRNLAYLQPRQDHLRIATPFLRLKVSYRRIVSINPTKMGQLFSPKKHSWAMHRFMQPFYAKTALVLECSGLPVSAKTIRTFLGSLMLSPTTTGIVLFVEDWMKLSNELESMRGLWGQTKPPRRPGAQSGILGKLP